MAKNPAAQLGPATVIFALYHALTLISDLETCRQNLQMYRTRPTGNNLVRLLVAEGVFIRDLGLGK